MPRRDPELLLDIVQAAMLIEQFLAGISREAFRTDELRISAVSHQLEIIGEAAGDLSAATRDALPQIPWPKLVGLRNRLIHAYHSIDLDILTVAAFDEVPRIVPLIEPLLPKEGD